MKKFSKQAVTFAVKCCTEHGLTSIQTFRLTAVSLNLLLKTNLVLSQTLA